ncbi:MAG: hypothetical protein KGD59_11490 [Candidatus Heimdallarchaeota archaeon]|nr:hypothetical protein [Candidatus Heimdallarchaeota archaeon]
MGQLAEEKALDYFSSHNCCQAVLRTVLEEKGLMFDEAVFVGSGFIFIVFHYLVIEMINNLKFLKILSSFLLFNN